MAFLGLLVGLVPSLAPAGPPFVTDDPEPTDTGHWEDYAFVSGANRPGGIAGEGGVELNYGAAEDLQLSASLPIDYATAGGGRAGAGDVTLGAKYRFIHQADWMPDVAAYPAIALPTGARAFGTGRTTYQLPIWMEKDSGAWSLFGGGAYTVNPGAGNRNSVFVGGAITRDVTEDLNLGAELYHQTAAVAGGRGLTALGFGALYRLSERWAVLASGGPYLQ